MLGMSDVGKAEPAGVERVDWLNVRPNEQLDEVRQIREAENVLSSYSRATDLLAEALQNATDAIDVRSEAEAEAPRKIRIDFDARARRFTVTDTGTGISAENLRIVLTPNVTLKSGKLAASRSGRSRGEKGVGLSFLALASEFLHVRSCDGHRRHDLIVKGASRWVQSEGLSEKPMGELTSSAPDEQLSSPRYTAVTVGGVDPDAFDRDLFSLGCEELAWELRTATSVGNTAPLFASLGRQQPDQAEVVLEFGPAASNDRVTVPLPYRYATPEELAPDLPVIDAESLRKVAPAEIEALTQGKGVRYVRRFESKSGYQVDVYAFIVHGRDMNRRLEEMISEGRFAPANWAALEVATRDMPTGVRLAGGVIQPRSLERRVFALLQYDELKLDLGRKTLAGQTTKMLQRVLKQAWDEDLRSIIPRVGPSERGVSTVNKAALKSKIRDGLKRRDLAAPLPYLKLPGEGVGVLAVFHEALGSGDFELPELRTLASGVYGSTDALMYLGQPNGEPPRHVLFAEDSRELIKLLESDEQRTETVTLAVLWDLAPDYLDSQGIAHAEVSGRDSGATHELVMGGVGDHGNLEVLVLAEKLNGVGNGH
jgi:hypothetical protein